MSFEKKNAMLGYPSRNTVISLVDSRSVWLFDAVANSIFRLADNSESMIMLLLRLLKNPRNLIDLPSLP
jgi:hypothetical protein